MAAHLSAHPALYSDHSHCSSLSSIWSELRRPPPTPRFLQSPAADDDETQQDAHDARSSRPRRPEWRRGTASRPLSDRERTRPPPAGNCQRSGPVVERERVGNHPNFKKRARCGALGVARVHEAPPVRCLCRACQARLPRPSTWRRYAGITRRHANLQTHIAHLVQGTVPVQPLCGLLGCGSLPPQLFRTWDR